MRRRHVAALVLTVFVCKLAGVAIAAGSCDAKLVGNSYECTVLFETSGEAAFSTANCVEFVRGGLSFNFDFVGVGDFLNGDYGCQCEATSPRSTVKKVERTGRLPLALHLAADAFECVGDNANLIQQLHGKVDSDELYGQGSEADGSTVEFVCRKLSTACQ